MAQALALWWLLAATVAARTPIGSNEETSLQASRATSKSFTIQIPCLKDQKCRGDLLQFKKVSDVEWTHIKSVQKETTLTNLESNSEYDVEVLLGLNTSEIIPKKLKVWTCPEEVPKLTGIRAAKTGPGWLDVRWTPVKDQRCPSNIYYLVRYGSDKMTDWMSYGVFNRSNGGEEVFRPTHPCAAWDGEFCLLLTDEVEPGKNHTVEVKPVRYARTQWPGGQGSDAGAVTALASVLANASASGEYLLGARDALSPCVQRARALDPAHGSGRGAGGAGGAGGGGSNLQRRVVVPIWAMALACLVLVAALVLLLVARRRQKSKTSKQLLNNESAMSTSGPSEPVGYRGSSVYDDCLSAVHMGAHSLPEPPAPAHRPEPLYERLKGLQGAPEKLQGLQALAAAAAAKVAGAGAAEAAEAASNHYVAMGGHGQLIYDDAQGLVRAAPQPTYSNYPAAVPRDSNLYIEPGSPVYDEAMGVDARTSQHSTGYNRPYSHAKPGPWRAW